MSKLSQLHAELSEQAAELGFESLEEALANGYEVDYEAKELVNPYVLCNKAHEEAHEAWLKERDEVLDGLDIVAHSDAVPFEHKEIVKQAYKFIREQCHD